MYFYFYRRRRFVRGDVALFFHVFFLLPGVRRGKHACFVWNTRVYLLILLGGMCVRPMIPRGGSPATNKPSYSISTFARTLQCTCSARLCRVDTDVIALRYV